MTRVKPQIEFMYPAEEAEKHIWSGVPTNAPVSLVRYLQVVAVDHHDPHKLKPCTEEEGVGKGGHTSELFVTTNVNVYST